MGRISCFAPSFPQIPNEYTVAPRKYTPSNSQQSIDFVFEVHLENKPVFVLGIREPGTIVFRSAREEADTEIYRDPPFGSNLPHPSVL
jgi:hypothetical protein